MLRDEWEAWGNNPDSVERERLRHYADKLDGIIKHIESEIKIIGE